MRNKSAKRNVHVTENGLIEIADSPMFAFTQLSLIKQARLFWLTADSLNRAEPATVEALTAAHQLASWATEIEASVVRSSPCDCQNTYEHCVCDKLAAEHYLETGDITRLVELGWPRFGYISGALESGDVIPDDLLTSACRTRYQKGATPIDIRIQSLG